MVSQSEVKSISKKYSDHVMYLFPQYPIVRGGRADEIALLVNRIRAKGIDDETSEFTNTVQSFTTPEFMDFLGNRSRSCKPPVNPFQRLITG